MHPLDPLDALAVIVILSLFGGGIIATCLRAKPLEEDWEWVRVGTFDGIPHFERVRKPRHDASAERANADRRSLSGGAAKPLFHSAPNASEGQ